MIDIKSWTQEFAGKLKDAFGIRLKFLGYQGSYGRGEATEESDIDIVTVLDRVSTKDLDRYRSLVSGMPQGELACGFLCGEKELRGWPKYDLYGLLLDTTPVLGDLHPLVPKLGRRDAWEALHIGVSNLYHAACHTYLYGQDRRAALPGLGKSAFFCLRLAALLRGNVYHAAKRDLLPLLEGAERGLLLLSLEPERAAAASEQEVAQDYDLLLDWCREILCSGMDAIL